MIVSRRGSLCLGAMALVIAAGCSHRVPNAAVERPALLVTEVRDSLGLPLPDAKLDVFTPVEGSFWDWIAVEPAALPEGTHLLRFSAPGYEPSMFSVLLRNGRRVTDPPCHRSTIDRADARPWANCCDEQREPIAVGQCQTAAAARS